jgi:hypothetical protein
MSDLEQYLEPATLEDIGAGDDSVQEVNESLDNLEAEAQDTVVTDGDDKPSLEDQLSNMEDGEAQEPEAILGHLNDLGITRNGLPVSFEDLDQAKEMLSKGFDYTQKTQELADERKAFEAEYAERETALDTQIQELEEYKTELDTKVTENDVMGEVLAELHETDPDIFNEIAQAFKQRMGAREYQVNNPAIKSANDRISQLEQALQGKSEKETQEENDSIVKEWDDGLTEIQSTYGKKVKTLGVRPNWEKVKEHWQNDSNGTTSVKEAFFAVHGDQLTKALEAQTKLAQTKARTSHRMGPANNGQQQPSSASKSGTENGTYMSELNKIVEAHGF